MTRSGLLFNNVDAMASPASPEPDLKKYFSSNVPLGVYALWLVARETVDSCKSTSEAISAKISGFMPISLISRNESDAQKFAGHLQQRLVPTL